MLVYNLLIAGIAVLGIILCEIKKSKRNTIIFFCASSLALVLIAAFRAETVCVDYPMYKDYFANICNNDFGYLFSAKNPYRIEIGYSLLNYFVSIFSHDVRVLMTVIAIVFTALTAWLLYKHCSIPWLGMFIYASFGLYGNNLNFIRQSLAISIYLFSLKYIREKKLIPYLLIVLLAATFHKSLIFMLPVYFIANIKINWKSLTSYAAIAALALVFVWPLFDFFTTYLFPYYATFEGQYYMRSRDINTAVVPILVALAAVCLKKFILERDPKNKVYITFAVFSGLLFILTCQHFLFQRFAVMFFSAVMLIVPEIVMCAMPKKELTEELEATLAQRQELTGKDKKKNKTALKQEKLIQQKIVASKYYYYDSVGAVVVAGFLYQLFLLFANRIGLVPYITWF